MSNPIDVLFGPSVVLRLRHKPKALARIAERVKPLLMAAVHPDTNHDVGPEVAAEISEAYQTLISTQPEELEELIETFLSKQREREESLKEILRQTENSNVQLRQTLEVKDRQMSILHTNLFHEHDRLYSWVLSEHGISSRFVPKGAIPRGEFHKYRIVVDYWHGNPRNFFRGYEFNKMGQIIKAVKSGSLDIASGRLPLKRGGTSRLEIRPSKQSNNFLLGSTTKILRDMELARGIKDGLIEPFVAIDRHLIFCWVYKQKLRKDPSVGGRVVEIIPLE